MLTGILFIFVNSVPILAPGWKFRLPMTHFEQVSFMSFTYFCSMSVYVMVNMQKWAFCKMFQQFAKCPAICKRFTLLLKCFSGVWTKPVFRYRFKILFVGSDRSGASRKIQCSVQEIMNWPFKSSVKATLEKSMIIDKDRMLFISVAVPFC